MNNNQVVIERLLNAPVDFVWQIWTMPQFIQQWFGSDPKGTVLSIDIDLTLGGHYRIAFQDSDGTTHAAFGEYLEITEESRLHCTWEWESEPGHVTELSVEFTPEGEKTRLALTHANLNPSSLHGYKDGWNATVDKIVEKIIKK